MCYFQAGVDDSQAWVSRALRSGVQQCLRCGRSISLDP